MGDPLETVAFLANSENRVRLLEDLAETPRTRADLHEETGIARATLGRILSDLQDRSWVCQEGGHYEATPEGDHLVTEFDALLDTVAALDELGDLVQWFPAEDVSFDLGRLRDARVTRPSKDDALRPMARSLSLIRSADHVRLVAGQHATPALEAFRNRVVEEGRLNLEMILTAGVIDAMCSGDLDATLLRDLVDSDRAAIYRTSRRHEYNCGANDDTIIFTLSDEHGAPQALVESEDATVQRWFESFFEDVRTEATRLTVGDLPE